MRKNISYCFVLIIMLTASVCWSQKSGAASKPAVLAADSTGVFISQSVLEVSNTLHFKYYDFLKKAKNSDQDALKELLLFHKSIDGTDALNHSVTCLELIPVANDENFALTVRRLNPKLKSILLDRILMAQSRTRRKELQKPMDTWAPMSWAALNDKPIPGMCDMTQEKPRTKPGQKAAESPAALPGAAMPKSDAEAPRGRH
jgi:hypothetical protein